MTCRYMCEHNCVAICRQPTVQTKIKHFVYTMRTAAAAATVAVVVDFGRVENTLRPLAVSLRSSSNSSSARSPSKLRSF